MTLEVSGEPEAVKLVTRALAHILRIYEVGVDRPHLRYPGQVRRVVTASPYLSTLTGREVADRSLAALKAAGQ